MTTLNDCREQLSGVGAIFAGDGQSISFRDGGGVAWPKAWAESSADACHGASGAAFAMVRILTSFVTERLKVQQDHDLSEVGRARKVADLATAAFNSLITHNQTVVNGYKLTLAASEKFYEPAAVADVQEALGDIEIRGWALARPMAEQIGLLQTGKDKRSARIALAIRRSPIPLDPNVDSFINERWREIKDAEYPGMALALKHAVEVVEGAAIVARQVGSVFRGKVEDFMRLFAAKANNPAWPDAMELFNLDRDFQRSEVLAQAGA